MSHHLHKAEDSARTRCSLSWSTQPCPGIFAETNRALRLRDAQLLHSRLPFIAWLLQASVKKLKQRSGLGYRVWSQASKEVARYYRHHGALCWEALTSVSLTLSPELLKSFGGEQGVLTAIDFDCAYEIGPLTFFPGEDEVILSPGCIAGQVSSYGMSLVRGSMN